MRATARELLTERSGSQAKGEMKPKGESERSKAAASGKHKGHKGKAVGS
jgi:hypothetical protein